MKTTSYRLLIPVLVVTVALTALSLVASSRATAQGETPQFKVGDRVEVDILHISTSSPEDMQVWKKGTVTEIDLRPGYRPNYVVQLDPLPGQLPESTRIPVTRNAT